MKMLRGLVISFVAVFIVADGVSAATHQWALTLGGNGHYYQDFLPRGGITWTAAKAAAERSQLFGVNGHLVTITSGAEWDFVTTKFPFTGTWIGLSDRVREGQFEWVTGEPFTFSAWNRNEPNNAGDEDYVYYEFGRNGSVGWNDFQNSVNLHSAQFPLGYVVEYPVFGPTGDFNLDGTLDTTDIDMLSETVRRGSNDAFFDLTDDGLVNNNDRIVWIEGKYGTLFGDANLDRTVLFEDFLLLSNSFGGPGNWMNGDFDGSGFVGFDDFLLLSNSYGHSAISAAHAVPEPDGWLACIVSTMCVLAGRRPRSNRRSA